MQFQVILINVATSKTIGNIYGQFEKKATPLQSDFSSLVRVLISGMILGYVITKTPFRKNMARQASKTVESAI